LHASAAERTATLKNWSIRNSAGSLSCEAHERRDGSKLKNWRNNGTLVPSTDEIVNTGVMADLPNPRTASISSSVVRTA
jgi:hypothetical protein